MKTIKLLRTKRYFHRDTLYLLGKKYTVKDEVANELLGKTDAEDLPYFVETSADAEQIERAAKIRSAEAKNTRRKREAAPVAEDDFDSAQEEGVVV